jgi:catechol 2,3-dioxygenase-like lactoylglutathione lyase family enzyme
MPAADHDPRPPVWVGHVRAPAPDVPAATRFWETMGMRVISGQPDFAVLELRGGTHVVITPERAGEPSNVPFDIMVDDVEATWERLREAGLEPSPITPGSIHSSFTVTDPAGRPVTVNSSHVVGPV